MFILFVFVSAANSYIPQKSLLTRLDWKVDVL